MTRHEMLSRMSGQEFSGWLALATVEGKEAEYRRHVADSGDGIVHMSGRDEDEDDGHEVDELEEVIDNGGDS